MKVVVKMVLLPTMLGKALNPWMALAIMADATKIASGRIGEEDVSTKIDRLSGPHKPPTGARQSGQFRCTIDCDEDIDVLGNCLGC